jgi:hypothetical protein
MRWVHSVDTSKRTLFKAFSYSMTAPMRSPRSCFARPSDNISAACQNQDACYTPTYLTINKSHDVSRDACSIRFLSVNVRVLHTCVLHVVACRW